MNNQVKDEIIAYAVKSAMASLRTAMIEITKKPAIYDKSQQPDSTNAAIVNLLESGKNLQGQDLVQNYIKIAALACCSCVIPIADDVKDDMTQTFG